MRDVNYAEEAANTPLYNDLAQIALSGLFR